MTLDSEDKILRFSRCQKCDLFRPGVDPTMDWVLQIKNAKIMSDRLKNLGEIAKIEEGLLCNLCKEVTKKRIEMRWRL